MEKFPEILKELREEKNLSQKGLAGKLGFKNQTVIANWETGSRMPDIINLIKLAKFFNVTIDYLVGLEK